MANLYTTDALLADESFQAYALGTDAAAVRHWQALRAQQPAQEAAFAEAAAVVRLLQASQRPVAPAALKKQEAARLWQAMHAPVARPRLRSARRWSAVGAALLVLALLLGGAWWLRRPAAPAYARYVAPAAGQRTLTLPDNSRVVLENGAALTVAATWQPRQLRQAWLQGSAYFEVAHTGPAALRQVPGAPAAAKFVVHAGPLDVAVLGTRFTVLRNGSSTKVVLAEGQVELSRIQGRPERLLLRPGQLAECDAAAPDAPLARREVKPRLYSAWTSGQLDFDDLPVADIVAMLQDTYGLQIVVRDKSLLQQHLTGTLPTQDVDALLAAFGKILDARVYHQGSRVVIE